MLAPAPKAGALFAKAVKPPVAGFGADAPNADVGVEKADWPNAGCPKDGLPKAPDAVAPPKAEVELEAGGAVPLLFFVACSKAWKALLNVFCIQVH